LCASISIYACVASVLLIVLSPVFWADSPLTERTEIGESLRTFTRPIRPGAFGLRTHVTADDYSSVYLSQNNSNSNNRCYSKL